MNFRQVEENYQQLEGQFAAGKLSEADFKAQLKKLMFQDDKGNWWIIGYETKKWYRYNGKEWVRANPRAEKYITYGLIASFVVVVLMSIWGIVSSFSLSKMNSTPSPTVPPGEFGPATTPAESTCAGCHNDAGIIAVKREGWQATAHGNGTTYLEEYSNQTCSFCHAGSSFSVAIIAGTNFSNQEAAATNPSRQNCYTCHKIHVTNTSADWALETEAPVTLVISGATFDGGTGNLCANCHQARRYMANFASKDASGNPIAGQVDITIRFNPHLSNQADMLLGVGGGGEVTGSPAAHYSMVENTCVGCHMGESANHTFGAEASACVACHADAVNIDINGMVTEMQGKFDALKTALIEAKQLDEEDFPIVAKGVDEAAAFPLWVYGYIMEDGSMGVHNPKYASALLDAALAALGK